MKTSTKVALGLAGLYVIKKLNERNQVIRAEEVTYTDTAVSTQNKANRRLPKLPGSKGVVPDFEACFFLSIGMSLICVFALYFLYVNLVHKYLHVDWGVFLGIFVVTFLVQGMCFAILDSLSSSNLFSTKDEKLLNLLFKARLTKKEDFRELSYSLCRRIKKVTVEFILLTPIFYVWAFTVLSVLLVQIEFTQWHIMASSCFIFLFPVVMTIRFEIKLSNTISEHNEKLLEGYEFEKKETKEWNGTISTSYSLK